jgi:Tfp pilus assembly protein PilV
LRLTRSISRARITERGFALIAAVVLAVLYFALMELLLLDSSRELREAQRFKARVIAAALAENAAERLMLDVVTTTATPALAPVETAQGWMSGRMVSRSGPNFRLYAEGETKGVVRQKAWVELTGRIEGTNIYIDVARHSQ